MTFHPAPGRVLCRLRPDIEEKDGFVLPDRQMNLVAEILEVGRPVTPEDAVIRQELRPGGLVVLPKVKSQLFEEFVSVRISDINIIAYEQKT